MDNDGRAITTLNHSVDHLFKERIIHKNCELCGEDTTFKRTENMTGSPEVFVVQYIRFGSGVSKIGNDILSQNVLKLNNVMYQLTGIVVHQGASINSGHYYTITHCWDTGTAFKLNDSAEIHVVNNNDFDREREKAYMLVFNKNTMNKMQW